LEKTPLAKDNFKVPLQIEVNTKDLLNKDPNGLLGVHRFFVYNPVSISPN
jgi:hypothetical protein